MECVAIKVQKCFSTIILGRSPLSGFTNSQAHIMINHSVNMKEKVKQLHDGAPKFRVHVVPENPVQVGKLEQLIFLYDYCKFYGNIEKYYEKLFILYSIKINISLNSEKISLLLVCILKRIIFKT